MAILVALACTGPVIGRTSPASAAASITAVRGSAYGYHLQVSLFGGPVNTRGEGQVACTNPPTNNVPPGCAPAPAASSSPAVVLPSTGGTQSQTDADGTVGSVGPATFFSSGQLDVSTQGTTGATGSVTSSSSVANVNASTQESFTASRVASTCTASGTGSSGSTTVTNGTLDTDSGLDANGNGSYLDPGDHPPVTVAIPTNPTAGLSYDGHIHVNGSQDNFRYVFNEQITNPDGSLTVYAGHEYLLGPTAVGDLYYGKSECGVTPPAPARAAADFNGDGRSDIAVFRPSASAWYVQGGLTTGWGAAGDLPVPADYDGDRRTDVAVFRPSDQSWYVQGGLSTQWGVAGDVPVPGDYNGDGSADVAVFRPSDQTWYVKGVLATQWGRSGDIPVPADYNGDGRTDIAVFRPSDQTWYVQGGLATQWGVSGDLPVPVDFNGDRTADIAVFRPSDRTWYSQGAGGIATQWGVSGDKPVAADYNGDGRADVAVFRPSDQTWYVQGGVSTQWGARSDIPVVVPAHLRTLYGL